MTALFPGLVPTRRRRDSAAEALRRAGALLVAGDHGLRLHGQVIDLAALRVLAAILGQVNTEAGRRWLAQGPTAVREAFAAWELAAPASELVDLEAP